jgi:hypothetical protein
LESDLERAELDAIRFKDFIIDYKDVSKVSIQYQYFMIMDILNLSKPEIDELGIIEYEEAFNYATITYKIRSMASTENKKPKDGNINFDQPPGFGIDPKFVSDVGK